MVGCGVRASFPFYLARTSPKQECLAWANDHPQKEPEKEHIGTLSVHTPPSQKFHVRSRAPNSLNAPRPQGR